MEVRACDATEGIDRNSDVASSERRKRGDAGWWSGGHDAIVGESRREEDVGKAGVRGYLGVAMSAGEMKRDGPPPYSRAIQILWCGC